MPDPILPGLNPEKRALLNREQLAANGPKHVLMDVKRRLMDHGLLAAAKDLNEVIGRLEYWQNS
jgi:hypothetical protein